MINLSLKAAFSATPPPFVTKLRLAGSEGPSLDETLVRPRPEEPGAYDCEAPGCSFELRVPPDEPINGDVLLCVPARGAVDRLFRRASCHNTLLLTERCDQLCLMCSQPPKNTNDEWRFPLYERALLLADPDTLVGISGGEPTLYKDPLLGMIGRVAEKRPDLSYHILSNGQHFTADDEARLRTLHSATRIVWGIPLYSHASATHDEIVGKPGAFSRLLENLFFLAATGARIELRTVITAKNIFDLPHLAGFIATHIPFISDWAIMGMEPIGYARPNWGRLFFDHSLFSQPIVNALEISELRNIPCRLYNVPRCTMPPAYRQHCVDSISDWKKKYLPECAGCAERDACPGFFEWYSPSVAWANISPIGVAAPAH